MIAKIDLVPGAASIRPHYICAVHSIARRGLQAGLAAATLAPADPRRGVQPYRTAASRSAHSDSSTGRNALRPFLSSPCNPGRNDPSTDPVLTRRSTN